MSREIPMKSWNPMKIIPNSNLGDFPIQIIETHMKSWWNPHFQRLKFGEILILHWNHGEILIFHWNHGEILIFHWNHGESLIFHIFPTLFSPLPFWPQISGRVFFVQASIPPRWATREASRQLWRTLRRLPWKGSWGVEQIWISNDNMIMIVW